MSEDLSPELEEVRGQEERLEPGLFESGANGTVPATGIPERIVGLDGPSLPEVLTATRAYLDVTGSEVGYIVASLAVAVSKALADEEPLWLILAGASGSGKTEAIRLPGLVADSRVDELTRAGLLSWTTGKKPRRSGLLTQIPPVAFVTISDFSTVVTMGDREARARMFGILRVVYDGRVTRALGGQPAGKDEVLKWEGHLTLLAGATHAIDTHLSFEAALGERWLICRVAESDAGRARSRAIFSVERERVPELRRHAQELARELVLQARQRIPKKLTEQTRDRIMDAATLCAHARTGVQFEGTGRYRVPIGYPAPEEPMRLAGQLYRLCRCLVALGLDEEQATAFAVRAACDSVPLARFRALREVAESPLATVASVHRAIGRGNRWGAKWELTRSRRSECWRSKGRPKRKTRRRRARIDSLTTTSRCTKPSALSIRLSL